MRLGELQADRAAADDDQMIEPLRVVEDRFVREIRDAVEARDRRNGWRGAGGDDEAMRLDALVAGDDGALVRKAAAVWMTCTPRPVKRSTESLGAMAAMTLRTCACTAAWSIVGCNGAMPKALLVRMRCARRPAAISALEGTQP